MVGLCASPAGAQMQSLVGEIRSHLLHSTARLLYIFLKWGPTCRLGNIWVLESHYLSLPRFLLYPPPVSQGSGTKEKFLVLLVLGLLTSWAHSAWHHSFGTQAMQGLGGHRTPQLPRVPGAGGPSDAVCGRCLCWAKLWRAGTSVSISVSVSP